MKTPTVCVGGVGGSGTRVISEILQRSNHHIGSALNPALDNLWFTLLLRQPAWVTHFPQQSEIQFALTIFKNLMQNDSACSLSKSEIDYIRSRVDSPYYTDAEKDRWSKVVVELLSRSNSDEHDNAKSAWKEPNTHVFLSQLSAVFPKIKYIHVIRNGYYMAYSKNQRQVRAWHKQFDLTLNNEKITPADSLEYWIRANKRAIDYGTNTLRDRFYLLNYDQLCKSPEAELSKIYAFIGIDESESGIRTMAEAIHSKITNPVDATSFSKDQIQALTEFGYENN